MNRHLITAAAMLVTSFQVANTIEPQPETERACHSCHTDGHTNGGLFDTLNDGRYENLKKVLSLRGVTRTGP